MDRIFHAYKMRYQYINKILLPLRASKNIRTVNIFINLDNFFHRMHSSTTDKEFQMYGSNSGIQLVGNIVNLIGHYKHWAVKEHLQPKIYIYYTNNKNFKNQLILSKYRDTFINEMNINNPKYFFINKAICDGIRILPIIIKYMPHVYQINTDYIEPSIIPYYIAKNNPCDLNILVSRDEYEYQYAYMDKWVFLKPNGDNSNIITAGTLWEYIKYRNHINTNIHFNPETYLWAKTILGDKYRNIPKLTRTSWITIIKYLATVDNEYSNGIPYEIQQAKLAEYITIRKITDTDFNNNLYCTSVKHQAEALQESDKIIIESQLEDLFDVVGLQSVCRELFKQTPINLSFILTETPSRFDEPNNKYFWEGRK